MKLPTINRTPFTRKCERSTFRRTVKIYGNPKLNAKLQRELKQQPIRKPKSGLDVSPSF